MYFTDDTTSAAALVRLEQLRLHLRTVDELLLPELHRVLTQAAELAEASSLTDVQTVAVALRMERADVLEMQRKVVRLLERLHQVRRQVQAATSRSA